MTVSEALKRLDDTTPNRYDQENKLLWLTAVDGAVAELSGVTPPAYTASDDTELLLPVPYDSAYLRYMEAQIRYHDGFSELYRAAMERYERDILAYRARRQRQNLPQRGGRFL